MKTRTLGNSKLAVSAIGYGCMGLEAVYGPATDRQEGIAHHSRGCRTRGDVVRHR